MSVRKDFKAGEFCWIDLASHDFDAAVAWYGEVFGWTYHTMPTPGDQPPYAFFMKGEAGICGVAEMSKEMKDQGIPPVWNSYIATDDCDVSLAKVTELGGTVTVPAMDVPGHGRLAFFMDPEGASAALWQATSTDGPGLLVNEPGGWCWNELMNRGTDAAMKFYGGLAGWDFEDVPMGHIQYKMIMNKGAKAGGMMVMDGPEFEGVPPYWLVYFCVASCEESSAKVAATGGKVMVPPMEIEVGHFSVVSDPQGAVMGLIQLNDVDCQS